MAKQDLKTTQRELKINQIQLRVRIESRVKITLNTGKQLTVTIVMPEQIDPSQGIISCESPLAKALLNKGENETFEYAVGNEKFKGKILEIQKIKLK